MVEWITIPEPIRAFGELSKLDEQSAGCDSSASPSFICFPIFPLFSDIQLGEVFQIAAKIIQTGKPLPLTGERIFQ